MGTSLVVGASQGESDASFSRLVGRQAGFNLTAKGLDQSLQRAGRDDGDRLLVNAFAIGVGRGHDSRAASRRSPCR